MPITKMLSGRKYNAETKKWQIVTEQKWKLAVLF